ncbi:MAG: phenylacetate--CoA ligase family protein, partial [Haloferacaceae archaeon]
ASVYDHAGATEAGAWGFSCDGDSLGLHFNEAMFLVEVLDEDDEPVDPGEEGRLVATPLDRRAQPYVRFELRDKIELASHEACDCGRTFRLAEGGILGRIDDLTKVNGVLLSPTAVEDVVRSFEGVADEYTVVISEHEHKDIDTITLIAERAPGATLSDEELVSQLRKELKQTTSLGFRIDLRAYESLDRPELKADRLIDEREHGA